MAKKLKPKRFFTSSQKSRLKAIPTKGSTRSRLLTDSSGYAAAEFNFPFPHFSPALIITEPNEDSSSWQ